MANILGQQIELISKEKGIEPEIIHHALEDAMVAAAKKFFKTNEDLQGRYDPETGTIEVFAVKEIVEEVEEPEMQMSLEEAQGYDESFEVGDFIEIPKPTLELGRIAAQTAKQVINQKIREAEREKVYEEYADQVGELETGIVRRREGRDVIVEMGRQRIETLLPFMEQSRVEQYNPGDRISTVILKVHRISKGPQIILSRVDPALLIRLFEREIPEVYDGTVVIKKAVREGGERAKVAVASNDDTVDPVGACVGMKGSRINAVIRELRGEKIDIIQHSDDVVEYAINALSPARIDKVLIKELGERVLEVIVPEDQLSLAIGKKGQNVRLASKLLDWEIDIKSAEEKKQEILDQMDLQFAAQAAAIGLEEVDGISPKNRERLEGVGIETVQQLAESSIEELVEIQGVGEKTAQRLLSVAEAFLEAQEELEAVEESAEETELLEEEGLEAAEDGAVEAEEEAMEETVEGEEAAGEEKEQAEDSEGAADESSLEDVISPESA